MKNEDNQAGSNLSLWKYLMFEVFFMKPTKQTSELDLSNLNFGTETRSHIITAIKHSIYNQSTNDISTTQNTFIFHLVVQMLVNVLIYLLTFFGMQNT